MSSYIKPIFIFSIPRSGSTFVQRILATHEEIATASEPWVLLPFLYTMKDRGCYAEYAHNTMTIAIEDFCNELPNGRNDYFAEIRDFILRLYAKAAKNGAKYFLDKTPRYHLIVENIIQMFPEGKFIFLWRNPLAMVASTIRFSGNGRRFWAYKVDIFDGLANLVSAYEKHRDLVYAVCFEKLLLAAEYEWRKLFSYLELTFDPQFLLTFSNLSLKGQMGDKKATEQYRSVSTEPMEKWLLTLVNPLRKAWCRHYLKWIGKERLAVMGYDLEGLLVDLNAIPSSIRYVGRDIVSVTYGVVRNVVELGIIKHKLQAFPDWHRVHTHS